MSKEECMLEKRDVMLQLNLDWIKFQELYSPGPSYHPSTTLWLFSPHTHTPPTCPLYSPQMSSDSWKVLGVYSVTTKQNHLKTKWAGECACAIQPLSLCGRREKWPLRIKGIEGGQGEAHHFNPQVTPLSTHTDSLLPPPLLPTYTHTFKCTLQRWTYYLKQSCLCYSTSKNKILPFFYSYCFLFSGLFFVFFILTISKFKSSTMLFSCNNITEKAKWILVNCYFSLAVI